MDAGRRFGRGGNPLHSPHRGKKFFNLYLIRKKGDAHGREKKERREFAIIRT